jgi:pimeloyl-ACP methyl ester carboxylesterase
MIPWQGAMLVRCLIVFTLLFCCAAGVPRGLAASRQLHRGNAELAFRLLGHAGPTVVFESGQGLGMASWDQVAPRLAACARVVVYDRAGIGGSPARANNLPVMADTVADDLAQFLRKIGTVPPYILVGHSLGGLYVQAFARLYPKDVAAVVLVDAASPLEPPGVFVSTVPLAPGSISAAEEAGVAPSEAALLSGPPFPPIPLIVLAATNHNDTPQREALWREVQLRTAKLSPKGHLEVVSHSGHFIQVDRPNVVFAAVLEAARLSGATLSGCSASTSPKNWP